MKFLVVDVCKCTIKTVDLPDLDDAVRMVGLNRNELDHGTLARGIGYRCFEYGLMLADTAENDTSGAIPDNEEEGTTAWYRSSSCAHLSRPVDRSRVSSGAPTRARKGGARSSEG
jgi:hypothetical protein